MAELKALEHLSYDEYLKTPHWERIREAMLWLADYRCQVCKSPEGVEVHHASGYGCLGAERPEDLVVLCSYHHRLFHGAEEAPGGFDSLSGCGR
jgi:hypothetical protein